MRRIERSRLRVIIGLLIAWLVVSVAHPARAQGQVSVVLVHTPGDESLLAPVRAELLALAWQIIDIDEENGSNLPDLAAQYGARAALLVHRKPLSAELWLAATETEPSAPLAIVGKRNPRALALSIAETLRARWGTPWALPAAEMHAAPAAPPPPFAPPPPERYRDHPSLWFGAAPALLMSAGLSAQPSVAFEGFLEPTRFLSVNAFGLLPLSSQALSEPEGTVNVGVRLAALSLNFRTASPAWDFSIGGGPLLGWVRAQGRAAADYDAHSAEARVRGAHFRSTFGLFIGQYLQVQATGMLGLGFEQARIVVADRVIERWGSAIVVGEVGVAVAVPGS